jgi:hypothetical protein
MEVGNQNLNEKISELKKTGEVFGELTIKKHMKCLLEAVGHIHE